MAFAQMIPLIANILGKNSEGVRKLSQGFSTAQQINSMITKGSKK